MRSVTWVQSKSHPFVNTADAFRERSHTHKSMPHVRPTGIFKPELWILWYLQYLQSYLEIFICHLAAAVTLLKPGMLQKTSTIMQPPPTIVRCRRTPHCRPAHPRVGPRRRRRRCRRHASMGGGGAAQRRQRRPTHGADLHNPRRPDRRDPVLVMRQEGHRILRRHSARPLQPWRLTPARQYGRLSERIFRVTRGNQVFGRIARGARSDPARDPFRAVIAFGDTGMMGLLSLCCVPMTSYAILQKMSLASHLAFSIPRKSCTTSLLPNCVQNISKLLMRFGMHPKIQGGARL